jgi:hypothetical protein
VPGVRPNVTHFNSDLKDIDPRKVMPSGKLRLLVEPLTFTHDGKKYLLDIRFRMLQPHELARAMSFPSTHGAGMWSMCTRVYFVYQ